jgi:hypothetical protein
VIWDCFIFNDEVDLLECRLIELDGTGCEHVLCESPLTFSGQPKPLYYAENKERYAPWEDRITHVIADISDLPGNWEREHAQREALWQGLDDYEPDDILLLSDADEIPRAKACKHAVGRSLLLRNHVLAVNLLDPGWLAGTVGYTGASRPPMKQIRARNHHVTEAVIPDAGWHFSWLGGPDAIRAKAANFANLLSEDENVVNNVVNNAEGIYANRLNPGQGGKNLLLTAIDSTWPRYMRELRGPDIWYWKPDAAQKDLRPGRPQGRHQHQRRVPGPGVEGQRHPGIPAVLPGPGSKPGPAPDRGTGLPERLFDGRVPGGLRTIRRACLVRGPGRRHRRLPGPGRDGTLVLPPGVDVHPR